MYITRIPNRGSPPAILLREGYRQDGRVKTRTLANLSKLPPEAIELLRLYLKGHQLVPAAEAFDDDRLPAPRTRRGRAAHDAPARFCQSAGFALFESPRVGAGPGRGSDP